MTLPVLAPSSSRTLARCHRPKLPTIQVSVLVMSAAPVGLAGDAHVVGCVAALIDQLAAHQVLDLAHEDDVLVEVLKSGHCPGELGAAGALLQVVALGQEIGR